jgi:hypothetical protein
MADVPASKKVNNRRRLVHPIHKRFDVEVPITLTLEHEA